MKFGNNINKKLISFFLIKNIKTKSHALKFIAKSWVSNQL